MLICVLVVLTCIFACKEWAKCELPTSTPFAAGDGRRRIWGKDHWKARVVRDPKNKLSIWHERRSHTIRLRKSDRLKSENLLDQTGESEGRFADRTGSQLQVVRIGRVAPNAIRLAAPRRRTLPGHPLLQRRKIGGAASRDDLERHLDEPGVDRRKRQLFGINDARHAGLQLTWQRALRIRNFACRYCASQHDCRDSHRFHGEFR